jgi:hypothetical protein
MRRVPLQLLLVVICLGIPVAASAQPPRGAPADVYQAYHATLKRSFNERAIWPYYTEAAREEFEARYAPEVRTRVFYMMKAAAPQEVTVDSIEITGETAVLRLSPTEAGVRILGTATLVREEGEWRISEVLWHSP